MNFRVAKPAVLYSFACFLAVCGCEREPDAVFSPLEFAEATLKESYAARAELGDILEVEHVKTEGLRHEFRLDGSEQDATMALLSIAPGGNPAGTLFLEDGRQIPLFIPFLEESYKSDLGL